MKIYHIIVVIILLFFTIFICTACEYTYEMKSYNEEILNGKIVDIYIDTTDDDVVEYYMDVDIRNRVYSIEINKHDFITYKVGDRIDLKFRDSKFRSIVK